MFGAARNTERVRQWPISTHTLQRLAVLLRSSLSSESLSRHYVLNVLRFLGMIDQEGKRTESATKIFNIHDDVKFGEEFSKVVQKAYKDIFDLHGDASWNLDTDALITFFRSADGTTAIVGKKQAVTFQLLAKFSGHGETPKAKPSGGVKTSPSDKPKRRKEPRATEAADAASGASLRNNEADKSPVVGLTVRIEINLPADGDETYNRIFKSIRENFLNG
jgi:hypothetical protein